MKNQLKTIALLGVLSAMLVGVGGLIGPTYLYLFGALAVALNIGAYFYSDRVVLRVHRARPLTPESAPGLHRTLAELSERAGIPTPRLYLIDDPQPNAFATGRNPEHAVVAVTSGLLGHLDRRQLRGVLAHELAHVKNRDILIQSIAAAVTSLITYVAHALAFAGLFGGSSDDDDGGSPIAALVIALFAPIAATLVQLGISRSREFHADQIGAEIAGDPEGLASALLALERGVAVVPGEREPATASLFIVNPLSGGGLEGLFSTHPPIGERVKRLREMAPARGAIAHWA